MPGDDTFAVHHDVCVRRRSASNGYPKGPYERKGSLRHHGHVLPSELERVRALWRDLADAPGGFRQTELLVVGSDAHRLSPLGWCGIVELQGAVVVACPSAAADWVRHLLAGADPGQLVEPQYVSELLDSADTLGPAVLLCGWPSVGAQSMARNAIGPVDIADHRVGTVCEDASQTRMTVTPLSGDPVASIAVHVTRTFATLDCRVDEGRRCRQTSFEYPMSRCVTACWVW